MLILFFSLLVFELKFVFCSLQPKKILFVLKNKLIKKYTRFILRQFLLKWLKFKTQIQF